MSKSNKFFNVFKKSLTLWKRPRSLCKDYLLKIGSFMVIFWYISRLREEKCDIKSLFFGFTFPFTPRGKKQYWLTTLFTVHCPGTVVPTVLPLQGVRKGHCDVRRALEVKWAGSMSQWWFMLISFCHAELNSIWHHRVGFRRCKTPQTFQVMQNFFIYLISTVQM